MKKMTHIRTVTAALTALATFSVQAQSQKDQIDNHSAHQSLSSPSVSSPAAAQPPTAVDPHAGHGMGNTSLQTGQPAVSTPAIAHDTGDGTVPTVPASAPAMDHGDMKMQGGSAPPDARDPHGYSNGLQLGTGDYAVPNVPRLVLADEHSFASFRAEKLERRFVREGDNSIGYNFQGWFGSDYDRFVFKAEGDVAKNKLQESRTELLWGHALSAYWDTQLGLRMDNGEGPSRQWLAMGIQGLAPYWFEIDAAAYIGESGRTALRLEASYDLLLTQKLVLKPSIEMQFYGKNDTERRIGSGLAEATAGLRLRYEVSRQFAPYIGVERAANFGNTADYVRSDGERAQQTRWVAGVSFWF